MITPRSPVNSYAASTSNEARDFDLAHNARRDDVRDASALMRASDSWAERGEARASENSPRRGGLLGAALPLMGGMITGGVMFTEALVRHRGTSVAARRLLIPTAVGAVTGVVLGAMVYAVRRHENSSGRGRPLAPNAS